jgi:hypothetical protein
VPAERRPLIAWDGSPMLAATSAQRLVNQVGPADRALKLYCVLFLSDRERPVEGAWLGPIEQGTGPQSDGSRGERWHSVVS